MVRFQILNKWKAVYLCIGLGEDYNVDSTLFYAYRYKWISLFNEGYTIRQKSKYIINKIVHIYQSNLQCDLLM